LGRTCRPEPDLQGMHKRQAELQHIQEVLESAAADGHLSAQVVNEFNRYCEAEMEKMRNIETAWKNRHKRPN
jgi:hypothetical protein